MNITFTLLNRRDDSEINELEFVAPTVCFPKEVVPAIIEGINTMADFNVITESEAPLYMNAIVSMRLGHLQMNFDGENGVCTVRVRI